jgi:hypothetical protein
LKPFKEIPPDVCMFASPMDSLKTLFWRVYHNFADGLRRITYSEGDVSHACANAHTHTPYLSLSFYRTLVDAFTPPSVWCTCILLIILSYSFIFFHVFSFSFHFLFIFFSFYFYFLFMFFPFFPDSVWAKGSSKSGGLLYIFTCSHLHHIFTCSYLYIITGPEVVLLLLLLVLLLLLFL